MSHRAWSLMALLLVAVTAGTSLTLQQQHSASGSTTSAAPTPSARVLVVGDSFTSGTKIGGFGADN